MKKALLLLALVVPGCGSPTRREADATIEAQTAATLSRYQVTSAEDVANKGKYRDMYLHIQDWRQAVIDHAGRDTLESLRVSSNARIKQLEARDAELARHEAYVVVDARRDIREQIALEVEKLRLIQDALLNTR